MSKYAIILTVCEMGNISKAAAKLNYSQSAVSQAIQSFEKDLGVTLFRRSRSGVQVLPGAEDVVHALRMIVKQEKRIEDIAQMLKNLEQGLVRIGAISTIATTWLPKLLSAFSAQYPQIKFELSVESFQGIHDMLKEEKVDFAFSSRLESQDFEFIPLMKDELVLALPVDHPLTESVLISASQLKGQRVIITAEGADSEIREILESNGIDIGENQYIIRDEKDYTTVLRLVEYGFGISVMSRMFMDNNPNICIRPLKERYYRSLGIACLPKSSPSFAAQKFKAFTIKWMKEQQQRME